MHNPVVPAPAPEVQRFMESVQPVSLPITKQIAETMRHLKNALGSLTSTIFGTAALMPQMAAHFAGNVLSIPSAVLHKTGSIIDRTRHWFSSLFSGGGAHAAHAAPAAAAADHGAAHH